MNRIILANKILTGVGYIAYPTLLVLLAIFQQDILASRIAVPGAAFVVVTIMRALINAPRPYEGPSGKPAAIDKKTSGKSFPSRHTFCMFMIACAWISWIPWGIAVGCILLCCACVMGYLRVRLGVHYPRDVIAAAACAIIFSLLGYLL